MPVVRTDGRSTVTWLQNFLGWVVYHIFLPMMLRFARESSATIRTLALRNSECLLPHFSVSLCHWCGITFSLETRPFIYVKYIWYLFQIFSQFWWAQMSTPQSKNCLKMFEIITKVYLHWWLKREKNKRFFISQRRNLVETGSMKWFFFLIYYYYNFKQKHSLMERVAHQTIIMQYMLELAKSLDTTPRATINSFFVK